mgnify:CR=1 FL=1
MNTNKLIVLALFGFFINAAFANNSARIGYVSDFFYRGEQKAEESIQASLGFEKEIAGLKGSLKACTNQAVNSSMDSYKIRGGAAKSFAEGMIDTYIGLNHFEDVAGEALSELMISVSYGSLLEPTLSVYRNLNDSLHTAEVYVSHGIDLDFASLTLGGSIGNTELTNSEDRDYYSLGGRLAKSIGEGEIGFSVDYVDADDISREFVFGTSISLQF